MLTKEKIIEAISRHASHEIITGVVVNGAKVGFALESQDENLRKICEREVFALPGVEKVTAVLTGKEGNIVTEKSEAKVLNRRQKLKGVKRIIAVGSGKGGVGKSTITVNLAAAFAAKGLKVAIADADIYGPSLGKMTGIKEKPRLENEFMHPINANGILCSSMAFLIEEDAAAIWRGPMATKALHQLIYGIKWDVNGEVDILLIDMPPGTGDIHLSLAQNYQIDGVVLVTTPQDMALIDVKKAANMFKKAELPILGVVENMSYFTDPQSGNKTYIFGEGGGQKFAAEIGAEFLGDVALQPVIREDADKGRIQARSELLEIAEKLL